MARAQMSGLSLISLLGNVSVVTGMGFVTYYASTLGSSLALLPMWNPATFPMWFGSVAFLFFCHFNLPGVESAMTDRAKFSAASLKGFSFCAVLAMVFGTVGAVAFGPGVASNVITDLRGTGLVIIVKLLLCFNLLATFPVVCRTAFVTIEKFAKLGGLTLGTWSSNAVRTVYVIAAGLTAIAIPSFGKLLGVVGGFCCTMLTCMFPPMMLLAASKRTGKELDTVTRVACYATMALAAALGIFSIIA